ncbi:carph-isopro domain-containing protein [Sphingobium sp. AN558]|uniref:carph-isopro domain-containing protein n=1 Tax=Sphingobium sp. AN558 TaxID=3133442 RepID=UPI004040C447
MSIRVHAAIERRLPTIAIANIGTFSLRCTSDYRIHCVMHTEADLIIDGLGGTSAVAKLIQAPTSTVHSWRKIGIPASRMAHLKLAARSAKMPWPSPRVRQTGAAA